MEVDEKFEQMFIDAVRSDDINEVEEVIKLLIKSLENKRYNEFYSYYEIPQVDQIIFFYATDIIKYLIDKNNLLLNSSTKMVKYLLSLGANINQQNNKGITVLMNALLDDNMELATFLLENGADTEIVSDHGITSSEILFYKSIANHFDEIFIDDENYSDDD
jgi:hypothetical protein